MKTAILAVSIAAVALPAGAQVKLDTIAGFEITLEGLVQADANWYDSDVADLDGDTEDSDDADYELRTAQVYVKGHGAGGVDWVLGYDAKADKWLDANGRLKFGGGEHFVQLGQFKQPNGLEELSAAKHNDFMSLAMITTTFSVGRRLGAGYSYGHPYDRTSGAPGVHSADWGISVSYFGRELTRDLARGSGYGLRGTWAPMNAEGRIFHLGASYIDHDTAADTLRLRARPDADLTTVRLVDTGALADTDRIAIAGIESFWVRGPLKLQGEYMAARARRYTDGAADFDGTGGYLSGVWNVTGQTWGYKGGEPVTKVGAAEGRGLWQVGLRYDVLDLNDGAVRGGRAETWTAGVNWYWRRNLKFVLNYVAVESERGGVVDDPNITEARVQLYW